MDSKNAGSAWARPRQAMLCLCGSGGSMPLSMTSPLAPVGLLWPKVFGGPKIPGCWPPGSPTKARSSPGHNAHFCPTVEMRLVPQVSRCEDTDYFTVVSNVAYAVIFMM